MSVIFFKVRKMYLWELIMQSKQNLSVQEQRSRHFWDAEGYFVGWLPWGQENNYICLLCMCFRKIARKKISEKETGNGKAASTCRLPPRQCIRSRHSVDKSCATWIWMGYRLTSNLRPRFSPIFERWQFSIGSWCKKSMLQKTWLRLT